MITQIALGFLVFVFVVAMFPDSSQKQSEYVQQHGVLTTGTVSAIDTTVEHRLLKPNLYAFDIQVALDNPVSGHDTTRLYVPGSDHSAVPTPPLSVSESVSLRVDGRAPGYAELPGRPYAPDHGMWVDLGFALLAGALFALSAWRHRRAYR